MIVAGCTVCLIGIGVALLASLSRPDSEVVSADPTPRQASRSIDKAAFQALGHRVGARYVNIVELVTFPSGMSNHDKITRIKQAYALDKQYFSEVTGLRGMVNSASNVSPEYMGCD